MRGTKAKAERKAGIRTLTVKQPHDPETPLHTACAHCGHRKMVNHERLCAKCVKKLGKEYKKVTVGDGDETRWITIDA